MERTIVIMKYESIDVSKKQKGKHTAVPKRKNHFHKSALIPPILSNKKRKQNSETQRILNDKTQTQN